MSLYDAFISYSHAKDKPLAAALQSVMQRLGKPWYRRRALRIFRDDTSLAATPELWPSIEQALAKSRYLIVLASPQLARSKWCAMEIAYWLQHRDLDTLLIAVSDGDLVWDEAASDFQWGETTPLPPVLKGRSSHEPKWIDLRRWRDAPDASEPTFADAAADLAAAVHGIPKEDLLSQELRQQKRALRLAWSAAAVLLALVGVAGWQWAEAVKQRHEAVAQRAVAEQQRATAERNLAIARRAAEDLVVKIAQGLRDVQGMRVESLRQILETAQAVMDELVKSAPGDAELQHTRGKMLNEFALVYISAGDFERAKRAVEEALTIMRQQLAAAPADEDRQRDVGVVVERLGDVLSALGDNPAALAAYEEGLGIARALAAAQPADGERQRDLYVSLEKVGVARLATNDEAGGLAAYQEGLAILRKLVAGTPANTGWRRDLNVILIKIGDLRFASKAFDEAKALFDEALQVMRALVGTDPGNLRWQRDLSISLQRVGDVAFQLGDKAAALAAYEEGLDVSRKLVAADPGNTSFQTSLVIMLYRVSTASDRARAIVMLREAIAILEELERAGKLTAIQRGWPGAVRGVLAKREEEQPE